MWKYKSVWTWWRIRVMWLVRNKAFHFLFSVARSTIQTHLCLHKAKHLLLVFQVPTPFIHSTILPTDPFRLFLLVAAFMPYLHSAFTPLTSTLHRFSSFWSKFRLRIHKNLSRFSFFFFFFIFTNNNWFTQITLTCAVRMPITINVNYVYLF